MDQRALIKRRTEFQRRRDAELRACRAKWRSKINSVDRLLKAAATANDITLPAKPGQSRPAAALANGHGSRAKRDRQEDAMEVVRQTLRHNRGFFTARMLAEFINKTKPISVTERGISQPLGSLRRLGEIRLVERGNGRKPHMYMKL